MKSTIIMKSTNIMDNTNISDKSIKDDKNQSTNSPMHNEVSETMQEKSKGKTGIAGLDYLFSGESRRKFLEKEPPLLRLLHQGKDQRVNSIDCSASPYPNLDTNSKMNRPQSK